MGERHRASDAVDVGMRPEVRVAFDSIVQQRPMIRDRLRRLQVPECDRDDVMQDILLSVWRTVEAGAVPAREHLSMKQATRRWLDVVVWHHTTHYREFQRWWEKGRDSYAHAAIDDPMPSPFGQVEARLSLRHLDRIDPALRDVVVDAALGHTVEEIAAELGQDPSTIQERLARGREQLRRTLRSTAGRRCQNSCSLPWGTASVTPDQAARCPCRWPTPSCNAR
ncbi:sigma-70 family RNA polymerase sigma factor [Sorangium sp. So ce124]|uniref:sigma-70 family RNA polymerase sigma factor n=1 Tax=Sorangium sp. So ce124 TaxID=3133280 RepID=UPI003F623D02